MYLTSTLVHRISVVSIRKLAIRPFQPIAVSRSITAALSTTSARSIPADQADGAVSSKKTATTVQPVSISPAGTVIRGINYHKGRDDPLALKDDEYPDWLWDILTKDTHENVDESEDADLFSKSKKLRRKAAKRQRKIEALRKDFVEVKVPITQQSIDLPSNDEGTLVGAMAASSSRNNLRKALRTERRKGIKEKNYLKSV